MECGHVGILTVDLHLPEGSSLKTKRKELLRLRNALERSFACAMRRGRPPRPLAARRPHAGARQPRRPARCDERLDRCVADAARRRGLPGGGRGAATLMPVSETPSRGDVARMARPKRSTRMRRVDTALARCWPRPSRASWPIPGWASSRSPTSRRPRTCARRRSGSPRWTPRRGEPARRRWSRPAACCRRKVAAELRSPHTPQLTFIYDSAQEDAAALTALIDRVTEPRRRPRSGRDASRGEVAAALSVAGQRFVVVAHHNPDGDAVGSMLGLRARCAGRAPTS